MIDLLNNEPKKYLPIEALNSIETRITGFSSFANNHFALYISEHILYFIDLLTGETGEVEEFSEIEVQKIKCVSDSLFVVAGFEDIYVANFIQNKFSIQKKYSMDDDCASRCIDATNDLSIIAISAYEDLIVIANDELKCHDMVDAQFSMAISPDGKYIASGNEQGIDLLDSNSLKITKNFPVEAIPISISFSPDGNTLVYGDDYANLVMVTLNSEKTTSFENPVSSKPIYMEWLDDKQFIVCFLSQAIGLYSIDQKDPYEFIEFREFSSRYFQYASLINKNTIGICVENLRTNAIVDSILPCDTVLLQRILVNQR